MSEGLLFSILNVQSSFLMDKFSGSSVLKDLSQLILGAIEVKNKQDFHNRNLSFLLWRAQYRPSVSGESSGLLAFKEWFRDMGTTCFVAFFIINMWLHVCLWYLDLVHSAVKRWSLVAHRGCFQAPGLYRVRALPLTFHGLDLSSWESHRKQVGKLLGDEWMKR